ncbi:MAG: ATP-binding protein [Verrucomicrobiota bacterium]
MTTLERTHSMRNVEIACDCETGSRRVLLDSVDIISINREPHVLGFAIDIAEQKHAETEFKPVPFDLRAFCSRISEDIRTATGMRCPVEVSLGDTPTAAFGDENLLRHILTNLLANAVKYSPEDRTVLLQVERENSQAHFRVIDRGCGIPAADQARLFNAFHRGTNVRQIPGTGLGLVIVKRCVELHQGVIQYQSTEGSGTTFTVTVSLFE